MKIGFNMVQLNSFIKGGQLNQLFGSVESTQPISTHFNKRDPSWLNPTSVANFILMKIARLRLKIARLATFAFWLKIAGNIVRFFHEFFRLKIRKKLCYEIQPDFCLLELNIARFLCKIVLTKNHQKVAWLQDQIFHSMGMSNIANLAQNRQNW